MYKLIKKVWNFFLKSLGDHISVAPLSLALNLAPFFNRREVDDPYKWYIARKRNKQAFQWYQIQA